MTVTRQHTAAFLLALALFAFPLLPAIDGGDAITIPSGVHVGCQELFVRDDIRKHHRARRRSSPRAPTFASSTNRSAS
jgi:hypothetical protein